jgi:uncharacterized membrane protein
MDVKNFFSQEEKNKILEAIQQAEKNTSGEIRVHLDATCNSNPLVKAEKIFNKLKMDETQLRNGILFYLAVKSKDFTVFGDKGIHEKVGADFWNSITEKAVNKFKSEHYCDGLVEAIQDCGQQLKHYFPFQQNDKNELNDEISFG